MLIYQKQTLNPHTDKLHFKNQTLTLRFSKGQIFNRMLIWSCNSNNMFLITLLQKHMVLIK